MPRATCSAYVSACLKIKEIQAVSLQRTKALVAASVTTKGPVGPKKPPRSEVAAPRIYQWKAGIAKLAAQSSRIAGLALLAVGGLRASLRFAHGLLLRSPTLLRLI